LLKCDSLTFEKQDWHMRAARMAETS
jgi:hypothetical protein